MNDSEPNVLPKEDQASEAPPCMNDIRKFVNFIPKAMFPDDVRKWKKFSRSCPYNAIPGSLYCRPHTFLNNAVTPEIEVSMTDWLNQTIHHFAMGYTEFFNNTLFREPSWYSKDCKSGPIRFGNAPKA